VLRKHGYEVIEATNGDEALKLTDQHAGDPIDILLADVVMPVLDGPELAV
jgi:CheY-like chemotaxis protein